MAAWLHDLERMGSTFGDELQNCPGSENLRKQQSQIGSSTFGNQVKPLSVLLSHYRSGSGLYWPHINSILMSRQNSRTQDSDAPEYLQLPAFKVRVLSCPLYNG